MKIFGQLVRTAVNVALLPVAIAKDVVTLGGMCNDAERLAIAEAIERLKDEAGEK